jgi:hypothetical protein
MVDLNLTALTELTTVIGSDVVYVVSDPAVTKLPRKITVNNIQRQSVVAKTTTYTLTDLDYLVKADTTAGAFTLTLPTSTGRTGKIFVIKKTDNSVNVLTVDGNASETIDGALTYLMVVQNDTVVIQSDGTNWMIIQHYNKAPYAQLSHSANQMNPASAAAVNVVFNVNDSLVGMTHSIVTNTHQITIIEAGVYQFIAVPQVGRTSGTGVDTHNFWMQKNGVNVVDSNIKTYLPATVAHTSVATLNWIGVLAAGDIISFQQQSQSLTTGVTGLIATAIAAPKPLTPSIVLTVLKLSD